MPKTKIREQIANRQKSIDDLLKKKKRSKADETMIRLQRYHIDRLALLLLDSDDVLGTKLGDTWYNKALRFRKAATIYRRCLEELLETVEHRSQVKILSAFKEVEESQK